MSEWWKEAPVEGAKNAPKASGEWWNEAPVAAPADFSAVTTGVDSTGRAARQPMPARNVDDNNAFLHSIGITDRDVPQPGFGQNLMEIMGKSVVGAPAILADALRLPATANEAIIRQFGGTPDEGGVFGAMRGALRGAADAIDTQPLVDKATALGYGNPTFGDAGDIADALNPYASMAFGDRAMTVGKAIPETLAGSGIEMASAMNPITLAATIMGKGEENARERAKNDKRVDPTVLDVGLGSAAGAVEMLLERYTTGRLGDMFKPNGELAAGGLAVLKRVAAELGIQGVGGGVEELTPYLATHVGTETGVDPREAAGTFALGALAEAGMGGGVSVATEGARALSGRQERAKPEPAPSVADVMAGAPEQQAAPAEPAAPAAAADVMAGTPAAQTEAAAEERAQPEPPALPEGVTREDLVQAAEAAETPEQQAAALTALVMYDQNQATTENADAREAAQESPAVPDVPEGAPRGEQGRVAGDEAADADVRAGEPEAQGPVASKAEQAPKGRRAQVLQTLIDRAHGEEAKGVEVVDSLDSLSEEDRKRIGFVPEDKGEVEGFYDPDTGKTYVFADSITPYKGQTAEQRALWVAAHERSGHAGLRGMFRGRGAELVRVLDRAASNPTVAAINEAMGRQRRETGDRQTEESFAELAAAVRTGDFKHLEDRYGVRVTPQERGAIKELVERVVAAINKALGGNMRDSEIYQLIADANRYAKTGEVRGTSARARFNEEAESGAIASRVGTRNPTAVKATERGTDPKALVGYDSSRADKRGFAKNTEILMGYPGIRKPKGRATPERKAEAFIQHVVDNLLALHDAMPANFRDRAKVWYVGANAAANRLADDYGITDIQAAGAIAALSPQKDWFQNLSLAERVIDAHTNQNDRAWDSAMTAKAEEIFGKPQYDEMRAKVEGQPLSALEDPVERAMWIRIYDQTHNDSAYPVTAPDGTIISTSTTKAGNPARIQWGSLAEVAKAISILQDGSKQNVSDVLGKMHKIRSFYNNIIEPNSDLGDVTIDTHAVAAGLMRPLSAAADEVGHNFGTGTANSSITGNQGTYGLYAEAYRRAAAERGVLPREMQSITWEGIRAIFLPSSRRGDGPIFKKANDIWSQFERGDIDHGQAFQNAIDAGGGIRTPEWLGSTGGLDAGKWRKAFRPAVSGAGVSGGSAGPTAGRRADTGRSDPVASRRAAGKYEPLPGAPRTRGATGPDPRLVDVAEIYAKDNGIDLRRQSEYVAVDPDRAARIAAAYEAMPHAPNDPRVRKAYESLIEQTVAQYEALKDAGYRFYFDTTGANPWDAMRQLRADQTMGVFPTDEGFGSGETEIDVSDNPLMAETGIQWPDGSLDGEMRPVLANDLFRAVHDAFGHGLEGAGFRADGEENAWQAHVRMFTGDAVGAITTETRGQNSWLNFGPHGESNRTARVEDTVFADQKTGLLPEWVWTEGRADDGPIASRRDPQTETAAFRKWFGDSKIVDENGEPLVVYHGGSEALTTIMDSAGRMAAFDESLKDSGVPKRYIDEDRAALEPVAGAMWFTDDEGVADGYSGQRVDSGVVTPVYLSMQNPLDFTQLDRAEVSDLLSKIHGSDVKVSDDYSYDRAVAHAIVRDNGPVVRWARDNGHDGLIYPDTDVRGRSTHTSYVTLSPGQIKSATGNSGAFDGSNPSVIASRRGKGDANGFAAKKRQPDAVSVNAYHYSTTPGLTALDPKKAGSGGSGRERRRFGMGTFGKNGGTSARLYFYVRGEGEAVPTQEDVVKGAGGQHLYQVRLDNMYDADADPRDFLEEAGVNPDYFEELVSDAGFDGFTRSSPGGGIDSAVAIVFDIKGKVPVEPADRGGPVASRRDPQTETPAFKRWFKDGSVVDAEGSPLPVYHGTNKDFDEFNGPSWFAERPGLADQFTGGGRKAKADGKGMVMQAYINLQNPLDIEHSLNSTMTARELLRYSGADQDVSDIGSPDKYMKVWALLDQPQMIEAIKRAGYDGVKAVEGGSDTWLAFDPTQVKSATGNSGAFDGSNPSIIASRRDPQTETPAFRKWFGDSKIVDENGEPLVVYHGTDGDFEYFDPDAQAYGNPAVDNGLQFFTSNPIEASGYARRAADGSGGANIMPVYLRITKPLRVNISGSVAHHWDENGAYLRDIMDAEGHDGIIIRGPDSAGAMFVTELPEQIKSATGNSGAFDPGNPSIIASRKDTGASVIQDGRLLSLIDKIKAAGGDLKPIMRAVMQKDQVALGVAIDAALAAMQAKSPRETGIKNEITDAERAEAGRDPILRDAVKTNEETLAEAMRALKEDPSIGEEVVRRLANKGPAAISLADEAILLVHKTRLMNTRNAAADKLASDKTSDEAKEVARRAWEAAEAELTTIDYASVNAGREWGRMGQFRQRMLREDFTLAALERKERARLERPLTSAEAATIKAMADKIAAQQAKLEAMQARLQNLESERAAAAVTKAVTRPPKARPNLDRLRAAADAARARLRAQPGVASRRGQSGAVMNPAALADLAIIGAYHVANGAATLSDFVAAMREDLGDMFDAFKADHPKIFGEAKREAARPVKAGVTPEMAVDLIDPSGLTSADIGRLAEAHVRAGVRGEANLIAAIQKSLVGTVELSDRDVRRLFSDYGNAQFPSQEEAKVELRKLRALMQLQESIDRIEEGLAPLRSGPQRDAMEQDVRERRTQLNELLKTLEGDSKSPAQMRTYNDMRVRNLTNQIEDLEKQIATGERPERKPSPAQTAEVQALVARRDALRAERDRAGAGARRYEAEKAALRKQIEAVEARMRGEVKPKTGPEQRVEDLEMTKLRERLEKMRARRDSMTKEEAAKSRIGEQISRLMQRLAGMEKPAPREKRVDSPEVAEMKRIRDELAQDLRELERAEVDQEQRYQDMRGRQIQRRIEDLQARIAAGDFAPRPRIVRELSKANEQAAYELDKVKEEFLRHQFMENLKNRTPLGKIFGTVGEVLNLSRAIMTSLDLSAILRQGGFITFGHPLRALKSVGPSLRAFASDKADHRVRAEIEGRPNAPLYRKYGLQLTGIGTGPLTRIEEAYASRWLEGLPTAIGGGLVRGSGRAYTSFLNKLRADSFDAMAAALGKKRELTEAEGKAIANFINVATGRGKVGVSENAGEALNTVFFAPRLVASRFQLLAGQPIYGGNARTRRMITMEYARFLTGVGVVFTLASAMLGDDDDDKPVISLDPRSAAFGKIRIGNSYLDPLVGLAQATVLVTRLGTGETVSGKGNVRPIREGYTLTDLRRALGEDIPAHELGADGSLPFGSGDAASVIGRFLRTKMAPVPGAIVSALSGTNVVGESKTLLETGRELITPMSFQDVGDMMEEHGAPKTAVITMLGLLGMGMQHQKQTDERMLADFNEGITAVKADVTDRLAAMPVDQWKGEMAKMKEQYGAALEGIDLDYYKQDGKYGKAGEPKRDKDGKPRLKSDRLSNPKVYRGNAGELGPDDQVHHIIPDNLARRHPLMAAARKAGYDLDQPANLIAMPGKAADDTEIGHRTSHPNYDAKVLGELEKARRRLERKHGSLGDTPADELLDEVGKIEALMRKAIEDRKVPVKDGRLAARSGRAPLPTA